jgi:hypothetical protein
MTARQIIQEIEALPPEELLEIKAFLLQGESPEGGVKYVDSAKALATADRIFTDRAELFQKLAQ